MATNRMVSKKELEESGLSLRDFLNKERGLTRKAPEGTKFGVNAARPTAEARAAMNAQDNADRGLDEEGQPLQRTAGYARRDQYRESGTAAVDKMEEADRRDKTMAAYKPRRSSAESDSSMKRGGAVKKMASGGSASSRADGIAQRGKTRGKMC